DRHHPVGGLVVLVETDAVEAEPVGKLHLIEIFVVERGALFGIVMPVRIGDPGGAVALDPFEVGMPVRHEMEVEELHAAALTAATKACGCSTWGRCPHSGTSASFAPGMSC